MYAHVFVIVGHYKTISVNTRLKANNKLVHLLDNNLLIINHNSIFTSQIGLLVYNEAV